MATIYHIATVEDWHAAQDAGTYKVASLATERFIHCSTETQLVDTANRVFRGRADLVVLQIDEGRVRADIRHEQAPGGEGSFPHVYGPLNLDAITDAIPFPPRADGRFEMLGPR